MIDNPSLICAIQKSDRSYLPSFSRKKNQRKSQVKNQAPNGLMKKQQIIFHAAYKQIEGCFFEDEKTTSKQRSLTTLELV